MALNFTQRRSPDPAIHADLTLALTAEERSKSRHYFLSDQGQPLYLRLPRGTTLLDGDLLLTETGDRTLRILAKPELVMTVTALDALTLLRIAYHLGNRHVPLQVTPTYLRFAPDPVLRSMVEQLGGHIEEEVCPFQPEAGAYSSHSAHHPVSHHPTSHQHVE